MSNVFDWMREHWKLVLLLGLFIASVIIVPDVYTAIFKAMFDSLKSCSADVKNIKLQ